MKHAKVKIAYIGGGSRGWTHILMRDLALCPELSGEVYLYDIDLPAARLNEEYGNWLQKQKGVLSDWQYRAVKTQKEALKDADFVIISITPGGLKLMGQDLKIARKYGIIHTVGDTVGPAGLMRIMRTVPIYSGIAHEIAKICPKAWVINYTNPMSACTRIIGIAEPSLKVFGCCHEVFSAQNFLATLAKKYLKCPLPPRQEIKVNVLGINHFTFIDKATWKGRDLLELVKKHINQKNIIRKYTKKEIKKENNFFTCHYQITFEMFKRYGILAAAGDRHLAEFVPWFLTCEDSAYRWGVDITPIEYRLKVYNASPLLFKKRILGQEKFKLTHSDEEGTDLMKALVGIKPLMTNVNYRNEGQIENLPKGAIVETNAYFSKNSIRPIKAGRIHDGLYPLVMRHVCNLEMVVNSVLKGDKQLGFHAFLNDPLCKTSMEDTWNMYNEMLNANKKYLKLK
ncbi:MAG: alpha-glucosidase/alpha-galactosidase [Elusimicrobia bacterium]|nr:alpha-glucosidase/alpha-galactosidase [Elusimicrobiota bacterium]